MPFIGQSVSAGMSEHVDMHHEAKAGALAQDTDNDFKGDGDNDADDRRTCFLKGTMVRTITGERKVEDLAIGDLLPTHFNGNTTSTMDWSL